MVKGRKREKTITPTGIEAVIFDLDGTLVDSLDDITESLNHALVKNGLKKVTSTKVRKFLGHGASFLVKNIVSEKSALDVYEKVLDTFVFYYQANPVIKTRPFPSAIEVLRTLNKKRINVSILSNKPASIVKKIVAMLGFSEFIDNTWGGDSFYEKKPSSLPLELLMKEEGFLPHQLLMVGDSLPDIQCAISAGVWSCFYTLGYGDLDSTGLKPDFKIDDLRRVIKIVGL